MLIFNMVLEPNFVLSIKQLSLHRKEISHVYNRDPSQCLYLPTTPQFHTAPTKSPLLFRRHVSHLSSMSCLHFLNLRTSSLRLMKPTAQTCSTTSSDQNPRIRPLSATTRANKGFDNFSTCHCGFPRCESYTSNTRCIDNLLACRSAKLENFGRRSPSNMPTRADWIFGIGSTH